MKTRLFKRPTSVTILALFVFIIAVVNIVRVVQVLKEWQFLTDVLTHPPVYQLITGLVWSGLGIFLTWITWRGWLLAPFFFAGLAICFSIYYWIDKLVISPASFDRNWLFSLCINGVFLIFMIWTFTRKKTKGYFGAAYGIRSEDR